MPNRHVPAAAPGLPASRRRFLGAMVVFPALGAVPAMSGSLPTAAGASDIIRSCDWAVAHARWMNTVARNWDEVRFEREVDRIDAVIERAADTPSANLADLKAKARLGLSNWLEQHPETELQTAFEALVTTVLREVIALGENA